MTKNKNNTPLNPFANKLSGDVIAIGSGVGLFGGTQVQRAPSPSAHATVDNGGEGLWRPLDCVGAGVGESRR